MVNESMEWELRALAKQLECLVENPDLIDDEDEDQNNDLCIRADRLNSTVVKMIVNIDKAELICRLLVHMNNLMRDYHLVLYSKRRRYWEGVSKTHWEPTKRIEADKIIREISEKITQMAQMEFQSRVFFIMK